MAFKGIPDYHAMFLEHVSAEIQARCAPGMPKVSAEEYQGMRLNGFEQKFIEPFLTNDAFLQKLRMCVSNVQTDYVGPWSVPATYNVWAMTDGIKEAARRLEEAMADLAKRDCP